MRLISLLTLVITAFLASAAKETTQSTNLDFVNVFVGSSYVGHTTPAAAYPLGMVQPGPHTGNCNWKYTCGYNYDDNTILGFTQNKLSGTGCSDLNDLLIMPFCGSDARDPYSSSFSKDSEVAAPGYYGVTLTQNRVKADMTCSQRVALHRYRFLDNNAAVYIDYQTGQSFTEGSLRTRVKEYNITQINDSTILGYETIQMWVTRRLYFAIRFSSPIVSADTLLQTTGIAPRIVYRFGLSKGQTLLTKVSLSSVSELSALANIDAEMPHWNFDAVLAANREQWAQLLDIISIDGTNEQKANFYTSLYHLFFQPNNICDADGRFRGPTDQVAFSATGKHYSTLSIWDTFRAAQPLLTLLRPDAVSDIVNSMLTHSQAMGFLPIWTVWGQENYCMIGNHAVPIIVEACLRNLPGIDHERAFREIKKTLTNSHRGSNWEAYDKHGYFPFDIITTESVSKTLECGYDDYCAALLAHKLGKTDDEKFFLSRSRYFRNLFDPSTGLMRGRDSSGNWRSPFTPLSLSHSEKIGGDYTEGNSWQYSWHVLQDIPALIRLMGGNKRFTAKLDSLFSLQADASQTGTLSDVTGLIGQYAHGNEPSHHVIYLFAMAGKPRRTAELIREVFDRFYHPRPDGLCGNDDCGQMSAWYIFSALGFYPVNPAAGEYVLGAPQIPKATIHLPNGRQFTMIAHGLSDTNKYVKHVTLNGKRLRRAHITYSDIIAGGTLEFTMCD